MFECISTDHLKLIINNKSKIVFEYNTKKSTHITT